MCGRVNEKNPLRGARVGKRGMYRTCEERSVTRARVKKKWIYFHDNAAERFGTGSLTSSSFVKTVFPRPPLPRLSRYSSNSPSCGTRIARSDGNRARTQAYPRHCSPSRRQPVIELITDQRRSRSLDRSSAPSHSNRAWTRPAMAPRSVIDDATIAATWHARTNFHRSRLSRGAESQFSTGRYHTARARLTPCHNGGYDDGNDDDSTARTTGTRGLSTAAHDGGESTTFSRGCRKRRRTASRQTVEGERARTTDETSGNRERCTGARLARSGVERWAARRGAPSRNGKRCTGALPARSRVERRVARRGVASGVERRAARRGAGRPVETDSGGLARVARLVE